MHPFAPVPLVAVVALVLGGCPPPPLSLDEPDARGNLPPSITSVRGEDAAEYKIGLPNTVVATVSTMTVTVVESDLGDTLYVRGFFDYVEDVGDPRNDNARAFCDAGPSDPAMLARTISCNLGAFCRMGDAATNPHRMDVVVSDRQPDDEGAMQPRRYLDVPPPGLQDRRTYSITCVEAPT